MRIIAGRLKGRRLHGPSSDGLRPTSDRLRETLFNVIAPWITGARVIDGFAGTGAVGLEAISRGATNVTFVENDPRAIKVLLQNIAACGAGDACAIIRDDFASAAVKQAGRSAFDLVWLDPPYDLERLDVVIDAAAPLVAASGRLIVEHSRRRASPESAGLLERTRVLASGDSVLSFYSARPPLKGING